MSDPRAQEIDHRPLMANALLEPLVATSLAVLVANDHWLKAHWPGLVTGKVSDLAGLTFFPLVLIALLEGVRGVRRWTVGAGRCGPDRVAASVTELHIAAAVTGVAFAAVKASVTVAGWYSDALGWMQWPVRAALATVGGAVVPHQHPIVVRADPWDLVALPAVVVAVWAGRRAIAVTRVGCARSAVPDGGHVGGGHLEVLVPDTP